jgi:formylglycine-generating enzyme required for sulfatase activity
MGYYSEDFEDKEDHVDVKNNRTRVLPGGSFNNRPVYVRSADRTWYLPTDRVTNVGFRPARTIR